ncbi:PREDICTED: germin-like protein subfamily 3 member 4 [Tarenaya hassleriana]|uniref:germin-like protein subfamily 3 member 4 n=1 Tax=Tarenaya hassleriana TaxID=28532 RepID=UPI00053C5A93|nr:PREDICTED: germin-like protein subfamily 3 member 4 [Tarenaya hassleriana]
MMKFFVIAFWVIFSFSVADVSADPDNLQDTCPKAPEQERVFINGFPCKNTSKITAQDFKSTGLREAGDMDNFLQSNVTMLTASEFPGLNTMGLSLARTDLEIDGSVPPHSHPRSSEILFVHRGIVLVGFIDTQNKIFQRVLKKGEVFLFPKGLLHYCLNSGFELATTFSFLNSQNPGVMTIGGVLGIHQEYVKNASRKLASGDTYREEL